MVGTIIKIQYGQYSVDVDGIIYQTSPRGIFRKDHRKPLVGDSVVLDDENLLITEILPRTSSLKRPPIANINQILLVFSLTEPAFSTYLAAKYLTYAHYEGIKAHLVLTKSDKLDDDEEIKELFRNNITCLIGQTGVGKTSLLNAIDPSFNRSVGEYSKALGRGKHQTKEVVLLPYMGGYLADTPGFSSLELEIPVVEISKHFPGMEEVSLKCFYSNCLHINEPKCEVKKNVEEGKIPSILYESYLKLVEEVKSNG